MKLREKIIEAIDRSIEKKTLKPDKKDRDYEVIARLVTVRNWLDK